MTAVAALQAALAAEHATVYGYGVGGSHLHGRQRRLALRRLDEHAATRDRLDELVRESGGEPVATKPAYALPTPVTDATSARALLVHLEDACAGAAWDVVAASGSARTARTWGVVALTDTATWAARWRGFAGDTTMPALPGQPD